MQRTWTDDATMQKQPPPSEKAGGRALHGWALIGVLTGLMLTYLLTALDQTIVGTALPRISGTCMALICIAGSSHPISFVQQRLSRLWANSLISSGANGFSSLESIS